MLLGFKDNIGYLNLILATPKKSRRRVLPHINLADVVRRIRVALGMSVGSFSSHLGVMPSTVYRWEHNASTPKDDKLQLILNLCRSHDPVLFIASSVCDETEEHEPITQKENDAKYNKDDRFMDPNIVGLSGEYASPEIWYLINGIEVEVREADRFVVKGEDLIAAFRRRDVYTTDCEEYVALKQLSVCLSNALAYMRTR